MFLEFINKIFSSLNSSAKNEQKKFPHQHGKRISNVTAPFELKTKNIVMPDNRTEKEIQALYSEIRELQAQNREKISKNRFVCL